MLTNKQQLNSFFENRKQFGIKPGLDRVHLLLDSVDNPENKINAIHIAGTNGKGSTVSFLKNILIANGYRVGVFISPSLDGIMGHILCNDRQIPSDVFISFFNKLYPCICKLDKEGNHPTEFEIITVIAFLFFSEVTDIAIIEVGMGGREDTTNCFRPILSIITNVDRDHTTFLGDIVAEIAYHKAGIIKENTPVITGETKDSALTPINQIALNKNAPIYHLDKEFHYTIFEHTSEMTQFKWKYQEIFELSMAVEVKGEHQVKNCSLAVMALYLLEGNELSLNWEKSIQAIRDTQIRGRFEVIPAKNHTFILDGAHNLAGVKSFLHTINKDYTDVEKHLLFAAFKDKELKSMLDELSPYFSTITLTTFDHPRAASAEYLYHLIDHSNTCVVTDFTDILQQIPSEDKYFFITGSLHFIQAIRQILTNNS